MTTKPSLLNDARWPAFVERYAFDVSKFAEEVCGIKSVTPQQHELFAAASPYCARVSVASGDGTGDTLACGVICLWHLLCYMHSNTYVTAPKAKDVRDLEWPTMWVLEAMIKQGAHAWIADYFKVTAERVYVLSHRATWYVTTRTAPRGSPENLAGTHGDHLLWLAAKASEIPDENFGVIGGALTDWRNRLIMVSRPTRSTGFFWETHNRLSTRQDGRFTSLTFSSEESPLVSPMYIKEKLIQYGGRDSLDYRVRILGQFPPPPASGANHHQ